MTISRRSFLGAASVVTAGGLVVPIHVAKSAVGLFVADSTSGPPTITSLEQVTGNFNHGSTIRINGSGFGAKPTAAPYLWDPLTAYSDGALCKDNGYWTRVASPSMGGSCDSPNSDEPAFLDNATSGAPLFGAATTSVRQQHDQQWACLVGKDFGAKVSEVYVSNQCYWDKGAYAGSINNTKFSPGYVNRSSWGGTTGYTRLGHQYPGTGAFNQNGTTPAGCVASGNSDPDDTGGSGTQSDVGVAVNDTWTRYELYCKQGDPAVQNGKLYGRCRQRVMQTKNGGTQRGAGRPADGLEDLHYGLPNSASWQDSVFPNGVTTTDASCSGTDFGSALFGVIDTPSSAPSDNNPCDRPNVWYVSELYADTTGARVELIASTPIVETYDGGTQERLIQIPSSWTDGTIEFTINKSGQYDNDISGYYVAVWQYPDMNISNLVQLSTAS